jgi:hypothetical protein
MKVTGKGVQRARLTHEECKRVKQVSKDEVECEIVDGKALANIGQKTIDRIYQCQDRQHIGQDLTSD